MGLFNHAWMSKNEKIATAAIEKISDQALLLHIVSDKSIPHVSVRQKAAEMLTDEEALKELAAGCDEVAVRKTALRRIKDGDIVAKAVRENSAVSYYAFEVYLAKYQDHPNFCDILSEDFYQKTQGNNQLRISHYINSLFEHFNSDDGLAKLAAGTRSELAIEAVGRLSSNQMLEYIAQNTKRPLVREYCEMLMNPVGGRIVGKDMPAGTYQFNGEGHVEIYRSRKCVLKQDTVYSNNDNVFHDTITFKCEDGDIVFSTANESRG